MFQYSLVRRRSEKIFRAVQKEDQMPGSIPKELFLKLLDKLSKVIEESLEEINRESLGQWLGGIAKRTLPNKN